MGSTTYLLTDIEGAARLWEEDPTATVAINARHDEILEKVLASHGGTIDWTRVESDSAFAAFADPVAAAEAAADLHLAIANESWPGTRLVKVRIALHSSAPSPGRDLVGPTLNRAACIRDVAHGGQTLLSATTAEALEASGRLPSTLSTVDLGMHRLRDLALPEHVFQLSPAGSTETFPALNSQDRLGHNLPPRPAAYIGSIEALAGLTERARLVTFTGPPGVGKSRTALEVAWAQLSGVEGVWWVRVSDDASTEGIATALLRAIGMTETANPVSALIEAIGTNHAIVVLDGGERSPAASTSLLSEIVGSCPEVRALTTSSAPLRVPGERLVAVEPMAGSGALHLLVQRISASNPAFKADEPRTERLLREVCAVVEGIPLALELVAADIAREGTEAALEDLRSSGAASALEAAVALGVGSLDDSARQLFSALGVFAGTFSLEAVEGVAAVGSGDPESALNALRRLAARGLVEVFEGAGATRFGLLDALRSHALRMLRDGDRESALRRAHLEWYEALVRRTAQVVRGPGSVAVLDMLELENENVHHALRWNPGNADLVRLQVQLAARAAKFWQKGYHLHEGYRSLAAVLSREERAWSERASASVAAAALAGMIGDATGQCRHAEQALADLGEIWGRIETELAEPDQRETMRHWLVATRNRATVELARALLRLGQADEAIAEFEEVLAATAGEPLTEMVRAKALFGEALSGAGQHERARSLLLEAAAGFEQLGLHDDRRRVLLTLAAVELRRGRPLEACRRALDIHHAASKARDRVAANRAVLLAAECRLTLGIDFHRLAHEALKDSTTIGDEHAVAVGSWLAAEGSLLRGDPAAAARHGRRCAESAPTEMLRALGWCAVARSASSADEMLAAARKAVLLIDGAPPSSDVVAILCTRADAAAKSGEESEWWLRQAVDALRSSGSLVAADRICTTASAITPRFAPVLSGLALIVRGALTDGSATLDMVERCADTMLLTFDRRSQLQSH